MSTILVITLNGPIVETSTTAFFDGLTDLNPRHWFRLHEDDVGAASGAQTAVNIGFDSSGHEGLYQFAVNAPDFHEVGPLLFGQTSFGIDFTQGVSDKQFIGLPSGARFSSISAGVRDRGTFGCFVQRTNAADVGSIFTTRNAASSNGNFYRIAVKVDSGNVPVTDSRLLAASPFGRVKASSADLLTVGNWHFFVVTGAGSVASPRKIYIDGAEISTTVTDTGLNDSTSWLEAPANNIQSSIGRFANLDTDYFAGKLSEIFLLEAVLTPTQISDLNNAAVNGIPVP